MRLTVGKDAVQNVVKYGKATDLSFFHGNLTLSSSKQKTRRDQAKTLKSLKNIKNNENNNLTKEKNEFISKERILISGHKEGILYGYTL